MSRSRPEATIRARRWQRAAALSESASHAMRAVSNVYVSCGGGSGFLRKAQSHASSVCVNVFSDEAYGRSSLTLAGDLGAVVDAAHEIVALAVQDLSLKDHVARHPRIGVADHVLLAPIESQDLGALEDAARDLASRLADAVPRLKTVAYSREVPLAAVRRATPYFTDGALAGPLDPELDRTSELPGISTFGPRRLDPSVGLTCVGAAPWVTNFNVPLPPATPLAEAKRIASTIRSRGGGVHALPAVQAVGLAHADGRVEVGCNLQDISQTDPGRVESAIASLLGLDRPVSGYIIGKSWDDLVALAHRNAAA